VEKFRFIIQNLGSMQAVFCTCKTAKFDHNKYDNLTFCDKMAISQEREVARISRADVEFGHISRLLVGLTVFALNRSIFCEDAFSVAL
jgi:hypothetical protein